MQTQVGIELGDESKPRFFNLSELLDGEVYTPDDDLIAEPLIGELVD